jgi:mannose-6-phosphate isomerase-like protein (cupin superfamily)
VTRSGASPLEAAVGRLWPECGSDVAESFAACQRGDAERLAAGAQLKLAKPYGENFILELGPEFGISLARLRPGRSTSFHFHRRRRELICVRLGVLSFYEDGRRIEVAAGETCASTPLVPHRIANEGPGWLEIAELFSPPDLDDKVRLRDPYGRRLGEVRHLE